MLFRPKVPFDPFELSTVGTFFEDDSWWLNLWLLRLWSRRFFQSLLKNAILFACLNGWLINLLCKHFDTYLMLVFPKSFWCWSQIEWGERSSSYSGQKTDYTSGFLLQMCFAAMSKSWFRQQEMMNQWISLWLDVLDGKRWLCACNNIHSSSRLESQFMTPAAEAVMNLKKNREMSVCEL